MTHDDLTSPVAAEATAQVKLCEPHIWFRLIEAQFALVGIKSLPSCQPAQASLLGHFGYFSCL